MQGFDNHLQAHIMYIYSPIKIQGETVVRNYDRSKNVGKTEVDFVR